MCRIYKICTPSAWREAERAGVFTGSADDLRDGFIHFSTAAQLEQTLHRHFAGQGALFLIALDPELLGEGLRWERGSQDQWFPHLYGKLDLGAVIAVTALNMRADGTYDVTEML